jgi:hypothetical protein
MGGASSFGCAVFRSAGDVAAGTDDLSAARFVLPGAV